MLMYAWIYACICMCAIYVSTQLICLKVELLWDLLQSDRLSSGKTWFLIFHLPNSLIYKIIIEINFDTFKLAFDLHVF